MIEWGVRVLDAEPDGRRPPDGWCALLDVVIKLSRCSHGEPRRAVPHATIEAIIDLVEPSTCTTRSHRGPATTAAPQATAAPPLPCNHLASTKSMLAGGSVSTILRHRCATAAPAPLPHAPAPPLLYIREHCLNVSAA